MATAMEEYVEKTQQEACKIENVDFWESLLLDPLSASLELVSEARTRLCSEDVSVRKKTMRNIIHIYHVYCEKLSRGNLKQFIDPLEHLPPVILDFALNKEFDDFWPLDLEHLIVNQLFPCSLASDERTNHWIKFFPYLSPSQTCDIYSMLIEKRRFQKAMKDYMGLRQKEKNECSEDVKASFQKMSTFFMEPSDAIRCLQMLHEKGDDIVFRILARLLTRRLDSDTGGACRKLLLETIGHEHSMHDFLDRMLLKCSNSVFSHAHVQHILYILKCRLVKRKERDRFLDMSTFDISSVIDILFMVLTVYPKLLKDYEEYFLLLFTATANSSTAKLLDLLKLSGIRPLLMKNIQREGFPRGSHWAFPALSSLCASFDQ